MKKYFITFIKLFLVLNIICLGIFSYKFFNFANSTFMLPKDSKGIIINVENGDSAKKIACNLKELGVINNPKLFYLVSKLYRLDRKLQTGEYLINDITTPKELIFNISKGKVVQYPFTIIEGWNILQLKEAIVNDDKIVKRISSWDISFLLKELNISQKHPEGVFLPDTYFYTKGTTDIELLKRVYDKQEKFLKVHWQKRDKSIPLKNKYEALILASIVEKEAKHIDEMEVIAGVYLKRMKLNMKLQADPTVIYGINPNLNRLLTRNDLKHKTPYNTYINRGLPPTPIAMPSKQAILAVLNPFITNNLYFVANGEGRHIFTENLEHHKAAIKKIHAKFK